MSVVEDAVARKCASLWPHLDERRRRLVLGTEATIGRSCPHSTPAIPRVTALIMTALRRPRSVSMSRSCFPISASI